MKKICVWLGALMFSVIVWGFVAFLAIGCAGRITNTVEWGETLDGGIKMDINRNENEVEVVQ